jgi:hypothetical protein
MSCPKARGILQQQLKADGLGSGAKQEQMMVFQHGVKLGSLLTVPAWL